MKYLLRLETLRCIDCAHVISALNPYAVAAAYQDHVDYVNARLDKATDPHFEDKRLAALIDA